MKTSLDRIDIKILRALQKDGRLSNKELAAHVGLAPSSCLERVRRLRRDGALKGFRAEIDPEALGIGLQAMISVRMRSHRSSEMEDFTTRALAEKEVLSIYYLAGPDDFLVHVAVKNTNHLRDFVAHLPEFGEVAHIQTALIFEHVMQGDMPDYSEEK